METAAAVPDEAVMQGSAMDGSYQVTGDAETDGGGEN